MARKKAGNAVQETVKPMYVEQGSSAGSGVVNHQKDGYGDLDDRTVRTTSLAHCKAKACKVVSVMSSNKREQSVTPRKIEQYGLAFKNGWSWLFYPIFVLALYLILGKDVSIIATVATALGKAMTNLKR